MEVCHAVRVPGSPRDGAELVGVELVGVELEFIFVRPAAGFPIFRPVRFRSLGETLLIG